MSTSVIQKYVQTYEQALHSGVINTTEDRHAPVHYDLWVTEDEIKYLNKLEMVALQAIERRLIVMVRWHRSQGFTEKLSKSSRLLAQLYGGEFHPYVLACDFISLSNV